MRTLMLTWEYPPRIVGGLSRAVCDLSMALARHEVDVTVVTAAFGDAPAREDVGPNLRVLRTGIPELWHYEFQSEIMHLNFALAGCALREHAETPFDVIHAHDWLGAYAAYVVKSATGCPAVATIHATEVGRHGGLHSQQQLYIGSIEWWLCYEAARVICCSDYMRGHLASVFSLPWDKIRVVNNGVNAARFAVPHDQEFRRRFARDDEKIVLFVGRLVREKGVHLLVEAAPKILHYHPMTRVVIAGGGDSSGLRRRAEELGVSHAIYFTGFIPDEELPSLYAVADVAAFPSLSEPFGIVALEAMAAGTPVVAADVGGLAAVIRHGENGFKCYPDNPDSLGWQILHVLLNPAVAAKCVTQGLEDVRTIYHWDRLAEQTMAVYREVV